MTLGDAPSPSQGSLAEGDAAETVIVALPPPPASPQMEGGREGKISQTTEHLLIAAGSIGMYHPGKDNNHNVLTGSIQVRLSLSL